MNIYLLNYNNYYNRRLLIANTLQEYVDVAGSYLYSKSGVNFVPGDDITTTLVVNCSREEIGDYLLAIDESSQDISSRWFILENKRERSGQYTLILRRDILADFYNDIIDCPMFVEKGTVGQNDPAIYNKEDMTFNQIKKSEFLLRDNTNVAWLVGYVANNYPYDDEGTIPVDSKTIKAKYNYFSQTDITVTSLSAWNYNKYRSQEYRVNPNGSQTYKIFYKLDNILGTVGRFIEFDNNGDYLKIGDAYPESNLKVTPALYAYENHIKNIIINYKNVINLMNVEANTIGQIENYDNDFFALDGKTIKDVSTGNIYTIRLEQTSSTDKYAITSSYPSLYKLMSDNINRNLGTNGYGTDVRLEGNITDKSFELNMTVIGYKIILEQAQFDISVEISNNRYHCIDAPYDMFCLPYGLDPTYDLGLDIRYNNQYIRSNNEINLAIAQAIASTSAVYDLQLLPYCPLSGYSIYPDTSGDYHPILNVGDNLVNVIKDSNGNNVGILFWSTRSKFTLDIYYSINIEDKKISNECDVYRLCSPNYNSVFEFSPALNDGVRLFNVDCTYKPYQPYIHINPDFKNLYGDDFNDARGLICTGDFSISRIKDLFAEYELQNKNYNSIFNRNIENMEVNNAVQREQDIWQLATGAISGTIGGSVAGSMSYGPTGAIVGGVMGTAAGVIGGVRDYQLNEKIRNEAIDYTKDLYTYNLQNIKALPNALSKVSAFNENNKIFPFIEYYTCTDIEKQALKNKIKYNGMTIMRIGTMAEFISSEESYFKAKLIRLPSDKRLEFHIANEIAKELNMGVFIHG